jgi:non-lysosomal glucosylceramidase
MKTSWFVVLLFSLVQSPSSLWADDLYNPAPTTLEMPSDDASYGRLTVDSGGKTPTVKKLDPAWVKSLADRGEPTLYTRANSKDFAYIGMPIGGIGAGELYLGGDGKLWDWDLFGTRCRAGGIFELGMAYQNPHKESDPKDGFQTVIDQGFVIRTKQNGKADTRTLDKDGFSDITFSGQYPIGYVDYSDPASPVRVHLEAYSPFIPSNVEDSSYPATILNYTVENTSKEPVDCTVGGWMENAAGINMRTQVPIQLQNNAFENPGYTGLELGMDEAPFTNNPPTRFGGLESGTYDQWTVEGDAFGKSPIKRDLFHDTHPMSGDPNPYYINTYFNNAGGEKATGKLTSKTFVISRPYITFLISGGNDGPQECMNLLVDGKIARTEGGQNNNSMRYVMWDVKDLIGKTAQLQIVDQATGWYGHITIDQIAFADVPSSQSDVGNMALVMLGKHAETVAQVTGDKSSDGCLDASTSNTAQLKVFGNKDKLVGALRRSRTLAPGEKMTVSFLVAWYFPRPLALGLATPTDRQYGVRFKSARDVVDHIVANYGRLTSATRAWHDTWYGSTLPYYFLDRTFLNASTLATGTSFLLADGRFYGYEGRYSCQGTCTHVYGYQQAMGFLFPDLEKSIMEKVEFVPGLGMNAKGGVAMRGEYEPSPPADGQSGIILRTYLAHRMSADNSFLQRNYASIKKATDYLINTYDQSHEGILQGPQANTMDGAWSGKFTWMSLYYQAALRATAEMADASNDAAYATSLRAIADKGRAYVESSLFNGEYFIHQPDPAHPESDGTFNGCPLEQLMGQNWAYQDGLGDIVDKTKVLTALDSIWKNNYTTDVGIYRNAFKPGRWYAMAGEGGLIMCTFPEGGNHGQSYYDNECWAGSEYELTATMMWDGRVDKALAEIKTLQERYDGVKRNPWDECECGSHYSRSMASYGVFTAACGYEYDGPKGAMAFAPRVNPENFKAAFTSAEGWGSFSQKYVGKELDASLAVRYGKLRLKTLSLTVPSGNPGRTVQAQVDGKDVPVSIAMAGTRISLSFSSDLLLRADQNLNITVHSS